MPAGSTEADAARLAGYEAPRRVKFEQAPVEAGLERIAGALKDAYQDYGHQWRTEGRIEAAMWLRDTVRDIVSRAQGLLRTHFPEYATALAELERANRHKPVMDYYFLALGWVYESMSLVGIAGRAKQGISEDDGSGL